MRPQLSEPVLSHDLRRQLAALPKGLLVTCAGESMVPVIRRGEQVRVRVAAIGVGDVFLFETSDGKLEMHRLIVEAAGVMVHRGDNGQRFGFTRRAKVLGRVDVPTVAPGAAMTARAIAAAVRAGLRRTARGLRTGRRTRG